MSILIKDMNMPKYFPLVVVIDAAGTARRYDLYNDKYADNELFEANDILPHGDLVDRNEMFVEFVVEGQKSTRYKVGEKWELNGEEIRRVIQRLPAVIPAKENE